MLTAIGERLAQQRRIGATKAMELSRVDVNNAQVEGFEQQLAKCMSLPCA
ncbi:MAG: hypothetical protein ACKO50_04690 [Cyanobium sp.]